jgi:TorA maturation chaperone TorD
VIGPTTMETAPITMQRRLAPEDEARAGFYALLARLFADAPDAALLAAIAAAQPLDADARNDEPVVPEGLPAAWDALRAASAAMDPDAAAQEYTDLFVGVGRSEVNLHASHWLTGHMMERPLAELRSRLAAMGLGRQPGVVMLEDHLSACLETMRILVAGHGERNPATLADQRAFFEAHVSGWAFGCCAAIIDCSVANYYRRVAEFATYFLALERDSLAME